MTSSKDTDIVQGVSKLALPLWPWFSYWEIRKPHLIYGITWSMRRHVVPMSTLFLVGRTSRIRLSPSSACPQNTTTLIPYFLVEGVRAYSLWRTGVECRRSELKMGSSRRYPRGTFDEVYREWETGPLRDVGEPYGRPRWPISVPTSDLLVIGNHVTVTCRPRLRKENPWNPSVKTPGKYVE